MEKILKFTAICLILQGCTVSIGAKINNPDNDFCKNDIRRASFMILQEEGEPKIATIVASKLPDYIDLIRTRGAVVDIDIDHKETGITKTFSFSTKKTNDGCELVYVGYKDDHVSYINTMTYINEQPIYSCDCSEPN